LTTGGAPWTLPGGSIVRRCRSKRPLWAVGWAALLGLAATPSPAAPPLEPAQPSSVPVPPGLTAAAQPDWTPDGDHLVFVFTSEEEPENQLGLIGVDGSGFRCLTCGLAQPPDPARPITTTRPLDLGKPFVFSDGKRVLLRQPGREDNTEGPLAGPAADYSYFVLECEPSLLRCGDRRLLPLRLPAAGLTQGSQNREGRISPDTRYFAWTELTHDGTRMTLARLVRAGDHYAVSDPRVVNPPFELGDSSEGWALAGGYYEIKQFGRDGRTLTYAGAASASNFDSWELDIGSGQRRRLTSDIDWDEDAQISPDGRWIARFSSRGLHRMDVFSLLPRPPFVEFATFAQIGRLMLNRENRFCLLEPWLTERGGERGGYGGQPLNIPLEPGWDSSHPVIRWHPEGTHVVFWERRRAAEAGEPDSRIRIVRLPARSRDRRSVVATPSPDWAPARDQWAGVASRQVVGQEVRGRYGGRAVLTYTGTFAAGAWRAVYHDFSDDGRSVLNGEEAVETPLVFGVSRYSADLDLSGPVGGYMRARLDFGTGGRASGEIESALGGRTIRGLPDPERCPSLGPSRLSARAAPVRAAGRGRVVLTVRVRARVVEDPVQRPVRGATVSGPGARARTDRRGVARLVFRAPRESERIRVRAPGFSATALTVRVPRRGARR
jgi:hypothetical protein